MIIYVNVAAPRDGNGSKEMPFKHINTAAKIAKAGDEVIVAPGAMMSQDIFVEVGHGPTLIDNNIMPMSMPNGKLVKLGKLNKLDIE